MSTSSRSDLIALIESRLDICEKAQQATVDFPLFPDDVQRRAAQTIKQLALIRKDLKQLTDPVVVDAHLGAVNSE